MTHATVVREQICAPRQEGTHQGLQFEESLIFEQDTPGLTGTDWPDVSLTLEFLGGLAREDLWLPGLSEPQVVRHYTRLSQKNYGIDSGIYPLGSCTMKHNPRLNEKVARYFGSLHPLQPVSTVQGMLQVLKDVSHWLKELTGMAAVALSPAAGAQGELCGMMSIRQALKARGDINRKIVVVPESAHGTNPATAAACGFTVQTIPATQQGRVDIAAFKSLLTENVAAVMLTNPNTCGLFEPDIVTMADHIHAVGGYFYYDGANFNAFMGRIRPGDLGIDCMHLNLHKTFSTPHGGGGPGAGPVVFSPALAPYIPVPYVVDLDGKLALNESMDGQSLGRLKGFHGQIGLLVRALAYMMSHGTNGLRQASEDAVLNANYVLTGLKDVMTMPFDGPCMHEVLFDDAFLKDTGVTTLDFAKAMIDAGFHPMAMYFPLVVSGALLIEPTESESRASLDEFIAGMRRLVQKARDQNIDFFKDAPCFTPRRRLDETQAARQPILRWMP